MSFVYLKRWSQSRILLKSFFITVLILRVTLGYGQTVTLSVDRTSLLTDNNITTSGEKYEEAIITATLSTSNNKPTVVTFEPSGSLSQDYYRQSNIQSNAYTVVSGSNEERHSLNPLNTPIDVAVDKDGNLYVSDRLHRVQKFSFGTNHSYSVTTVAGGGLTSGGIIQAGERINELWNPDGICLDDDDNLFIADKFNNRIIKFAAGSVMGKSGEIVAGGNRAGSAANQLDKPTDIVLDSLGNMFIADYENSRIQKWLTGGSDGSTVAGGNGIGGALNQLSYPWSLSIFNSDLYIAENENNSVVKWVADANEGTILAGNNGSGNNANQFNDPYGVALDSKGNLYVSDGDNHRVQKWLIGASEGITVAGGNGQGSNSNQLNTPWKITVDQNDNLYVADKNNHRIQKFFSNPTIVVPAGQTTASASIVVKSNTPNNKYLRLSPSVSSGAGLASSSAIELYVNNVNPLAIITASNGSSKISNGATTSDNSLFMTFTIDGSTDGFTSSDIITENCDISSFSGSGSAYTATLTPSGSGKSSIFIPRASFTVNGVSNATSSFVWNYDNVPPTISATSISSDNSSLHVTVNGNVYNSASTKGPLEKSDFSFAITRGETSLGNSTPASITENAPTFTKSIVGDNFDDASAVHPVDLDGDGDMDILAVTGPVGSEIAWFKNNGNGTFGKNTIANVGDYLSSINAADFDGDGDIDIVTSNISGAIYLYKQSGNENFSQIRVNGGSDVDVFPIDLDQDGDIDLVGASYTSDYVKWYRNDGSDNWTDHNISTTFDGANSVYATDVDGDGDIDVMASGAGSLADEFSWFENTSATFSGGYIQLSFTERTIGDGGTSNGNFEQPKSIYAEDVDGDGDVDILGASSIDDDISWFENNGSQSFTKRTIDASFDGANDVFATDIDGDGDIDVLATGDGNTDYVKLYENNGSESFTGRIVAVLKGARDVSAADLDNDGDLDIIASADTDDDASDVSMYKMNHSYTLGLNSSVYVTGSEKVTVNPTANAIFDATGNPMGVSQSNNQVSLNDITKPTITISATNGSSLVNNNSSTSDGALTITFTVSEPTNDFTSGDITVSGGTISDFLATSSTVYTATFTPSSSGITTIEVKENLFTDAAGNNNTAVDQFNWTYVNLISISANTYGLNSRNSVTITATIPTAMNEPTIIKFDTSGTAVSSDYYYNIGVINGVTVAGGNGGGSNANQFSGPMGIAIDALGNTYIVDGGNNRIQKIYNSEGITIAGGKGTGIAANQFNDPYGVAVDNDGNIYIADKANNRIQKWAPGALSGTTVAGGNGSGSSANQFNNPYGVAVDNDGNIYIADKANNRIQKWAPGAASGTTVAGGNGSGSAANQFNDPHGVTVDNSGNIFIADKANNRIQKWAPGALSGITTVAGGNGGGSNANQFSGARGIAFDATGNMYIVDSGNNRIQKFPANSISSTNGTTVAGGNGGGSNADQFSSVNGGIAFDASGNMYIVDSGNNRVQKFPANSINSTNGTTVAGGNGGGSNADQFSGATGIAFDASGDMYIVDSGNNRIQKFPANSTSSTNGITVAGGNAGNGSNQFSGAQGIAFDATGSMYIVDGSNNRIQRFPANSTSSTNGTTVAGGNGGGSNANQFSGAWGIAFNLSGDMYIVDNGNNRIQKFNSSPSIMIPANQTSAYLAIYASVDARSNKSLILTPSSSGGILSSTQNITLDIVDIISPSVIAVTAISPDSAYKAGTIITLAIVFSENITVSGTPQITLETGTSDAVVNYTSGSGNDTLIFNYTVQSGQNIDDLDYQSTSALILNGGTIKDASENTAILTLPNPGSAGSLSANKNIVIDNNVPTITISATEINSSTSIADGSSTADNAIQLTLTTSEEVVNFTQDDITVSGGTISNFSKSSSTVYTTTFTPTQLGASSIITASNSFTDAAGNINTASNEFNWSYNGTVVTTSIDKYEIGQDNDATITATLSQPSNETIVIEFVTSGDATTSDYTHTGTGNGVTVAGGNGRGDNANQFSGASGIAFDASGNFYVVDSDDDRIQKFPTNSTSFTNGITVAGGNGSGNDANQFSAPKHIAFDTSGDMYIADGNNRRIQRFPANSTSPTNGTTVAGGNGVGNAANQFSSVEGIAFDASGNMYVADGGNHRIQKFPANSTSSTNGTTVAGGNGEGNGANQLSAPTIIAFDTLGRMYILDRDNNRIQRFPANSTNSASGTTVAGGSAGNGANQFSNARGIAFDKSGSMYIVDRGNHRVQRYPANSTSSTNGTTVAGGNGDGNATNQFYGPCGIAFDTSGNMFITDEYNHRIQKFFFKPSIVIGPGQTSGTMALSAKDSAETSSLTLTPKITNAILASSSPIEIDIISELAPKIISVDAPSSNGSYKIGDQISIEITFDQEVVVTGTPRLLMETGKIDSYAEYNGGSNSTVLIFSYTVQENNQSKDLDYASNKALTLNEGSIKNQFGNGASLSLPSPGTIGSLGSNTAIFVDGTKPKITIRAANVSRTIENGDASTDASITLTFTSTETIKNFTASDVDISGGALSSFTTTDSLTYSGTLTPNDYTTVTIDIIADSYTDTLGNTNDVSEQFIWFYTNQLASLSLNRNFINSSSSATITATLSEALSENSTIIFKPSGTAKDSDYSYPYNPYGTTVAGGNGSGSNSNQLDDPWDVYVDENGAVYITDRGNHRIQKWESGALSGITVAGGNGDGSNANALADPYFITLDDAGYIYVSDGNNHRVQKWESGALSGITVAGGNGSGSGANQLNIPRGIALDNTGNLYIADEVNQRIQKWKIGASSGTTVAGSNGAGDNANQFNDPYGITVDDLGNIYIAEEANSRIQKWESGASTGTTVAGQSSNTGYGSGLNQLRTPTDIVLDNSGNLYIADQDNDRIQKWELGASKGTTVGGSASSGNNSNQLSGPTGLAIDNQGNIYVADRNNDRVQKISLYPSITIPAGQTTGSLTISTDGDSPNNQSLTLTPSINTGNLASNSPIVLNINDTIPPTMSLMATVDSDTLTNGSFSNQSEVLLTLTSSEPIQGFTVGDIARSGNFLPEISDFTQLNDTTFTIIVKNFIDTKIYLNIPEDRFTDLSGNNNVASSVYSWTQDKTPPSILISTSNGSSIIENNITSNDTLLYLTFKSNEIIEGFDDQDLNVLGGTISSFSTTSNDSIFTATFTPTSDTLTSIEITSNAFKDLANNNNITISKFSWTYNSTELALTAEPDTIYSGDSLTIQATLNKPSTDRTVLSIITSGSAAMDTDFSYLGYNENTVLIENSNGQEEISGFEVDNLENLFFTKSNTLQKWTPGDSLFIVLGGGSKGDAADELDDPKGVARDDDGNIYVADYNNHRIQKFTAGSNTKEGITVAGGNGAGSDANQLRFPWDVILDSLGNLYVSDYGNSRIMKFPSNTTSSTNGTTIAGGNGAGISSKQLNGPKNIKFNHSGELFVADAGNNRIQKFPKNSTNTTLATTVAGGFGSGNNSNQLNDPSDMIIDQYETIYITDQGNNRIQKWEASATTGITLSNQGNDLSSPHGIEIDEFGDIFMLSGANNYQIQKITLSPKITINSGDTTGVLTFTIPDNAGTRKYLKLSADTKGLIIKNNDSIQVVINPPEVPELIIRSNYYAVEPGGSVTLTGKLSNPYIDPVSVAFSNVGSAPNDDLGFVGKNTNPIVAGDASSNGSSNDRLQKPYDIAIDQNGNIYVSDVNNHRIQKFTPGSTEGITVAGGNGAGSGLNQLNGAYGLTISQSGDLYIADSKNNRILKWTPGAVQGSIVAGIQVAGSNANQLNNPYAIFLDNNENMLIADYGNHRIQKWLKGESAGITIAGGNNAGNGANQLNQPMGITQDDFGNTYISDSRNNRIQKWSNGAGQGETVVSLNMIPVGILLDKNRNLYVNGHTGNGGDSNGLLKINLETGEEKTIINKAGWGCKFDAVGNIYSSHRLYHYVSKLILSPEISFAPGSSKEEVTLTINAEAENNSLIFYPTVVGEVSNGLDSITIAIQKATISIATKQTKVTAGDTLIISVKLSNPSANNIGVNYSLTGTAIRGMDYDLPSSIGTITLVNGNTEQLLEVPILEGALKGKNIILTFSTFGINEIITSKIFTIEIDDIIRLTDFTPKVAAEGSEITITGKNIEAVQHVLFGGVPTESFSVESTETLKAVIGNGASGLLQVFTSTDTATISGFTFYETPIINDFSPKSGTVGSSIQITGSNFNEVNTLSFGGIETTDFTINSDSSITAVVAEGSKSGILQVSNIAASATASDFEFYLLNFSILNENWIHPEDSIVIQFDRGDYPESFDNSNLNAYFRIATSPDQTLSNLTTVQGNWSQVDNTTFVFKHPTTPFGYFRHIFVDLSAVNFIENTHKSIQSKGLVSITNNSSSEDLQLVDYIPTINFDQYYDSSFGSFIANVASLTSSNTNIAGEWKINDDNIAFIPNNLLDYQTSYKISIPSEISLDSIAMKEAYEIIFNTGSLEEETIEEDQITLSKTFTNYNVVAFPSTTSLDPTDVFSELGAYDPINWRLYARPFNGKDEYTEYGQGWTTMQRGKGYMLITREPKTIKIGGFDTDNEPQKISLESGWNLIGNPYLETLYWSDVEELNLLKNDITLNKLRLYNGTSYVDGSSLDVFEGAFLNSEANITIDIPSYSSSGRREADAQKTATFESQLNWSIPLKAYVGEYGYELSSLIRSAEEQWDPAPPRFPKYTEIVFQKSMGSTNGYIQYDEKTYFNIESSQKGSNGILSWDHQGLKDNIEGNLYLVDEQSLSLVNMLEEIEYEYISNGNNEFYVYYGDKTLEEIIDIDMIGKIFPNPSLENQELIVPVILSSQNNNSRKVNINLWDISGKLVITKTLNLGHQGRKEIKLDINGLSAGTYLVDIHLDGEDEEKRQLQKLIIR